MTFLLSFLLLFPFCSYSGFDTKAPEGFVWYKERSPQAKQKETKPKKPLLLLTATQKNEALSKAFESSLHVAIEEPTLENVKRVQALQQLLMQRSERFSETWMLASLTSALLYDKKANPNPKSIALHKKEDAESRETDFKDLSRSYGVFFIWQDGCRYCHEFLPIVKAFCETYGFDLMGVSKSGSKLPGIKSMKDNGMIDKINIHQIYPAVFIAHFKSGEVYPIAWGLGSMSDLETNMSRIIKHMKEGT